MLNRINHIYIIHNYNSTDQNVIQRRNELMKQLSIFNNSYYDISYHINGCDISDNIRKQYEDAKSKKIRKAQLKTKYTERYGNFSVKQLTKSELSLCINHLNILKDAMKCNYDDYIMICEDDICFCDNFINIFNKEIENIPDDADFVFISNGGSDDINIPNIYDTKMGKYYKIPIARCTDCCIIKASILTKLANELQKFAFPLDWMYCWIFTHYKYNVYWLVPHIATQNKTLDSLIFKNKRDEK